MRLALLAGSFTSLNGRETDKSGCFRPVMTFISAMPPCGNQIKPLLTLSSDITMAA